MQIHIAQRLKPFSHTPGASCLLPGSFFQLEVFPALVRVYDLSKSLSALVTECAFDIVGPVEEFTVLQDLERGRVQVWGKSAKGYFRYHMRYVSNLSGIAFCFEKTPVQGISFFPRKPYKIEEGALLAKPKDVFFLLEESCERQDDSLLYVSEITERLSLGSHKAQDWDLIRRRKDLGEIFPLWVRLGALIPGGEETRSEEKFNAKAQRRKEKKSIFASLRLCVESFGGTLSLLENCRKVVEKKDKERVYSAFLKLFMAAFHGMLVPRLIDTQYQGFQLPPLSSKNEGDISPLVILREGAQLIKALFMQCEREKIHILPVLPPQFHSGRFLNVSCGDRGVLNMEWRKKTIRRMTFHAASPGYVNFSFPKKVRSCRLRCYKRDRGITVACGVPLEVEAGKDYFFDNFRQ